MFETYHKYLREEITEGGFKRKISRLRKQLEKCLNLIIDAHGITEKTKNTCKNFLKHQSKLWRFVYQKEISPTNNEAERALRKSVIWRKLSLGTQSDWGNRFVERTLTVIKTLQAQGKNRIDFFEAAIKSYVNHHSSPSLFSHPP